MLALVVATCGVSDFSTKLCQWTDLPEVGCTQKDY